MSQLINFEKPIFFDAAGYDINWRFTSVIQLVFTWKYIAELALKTL